MKTKCIYITNTRLPSEKANSYQSMQMCSSFSKMFDEVELWTGKARNTRELSEIQDVFDEMEESDMDKHFTFFDEMTCLQCQSEELVNSIDGTLDNS